MFAKIKEWLHWREYKWGCLSVILALIITLFFFIFMCGCGVIKGSSNSIADKVIKIANDAYPDDNEFEEGFEEIIQASVGFDIDLSPRSPEK